jgi:hypothetical protein
VLLQVVLQVVLLAHRRHLMLVVLLVVVQALQPSHQPQPRLHRLPLALLLALATETF